MSEKQTISITRGLVELKRLNDRINLAIQSGKFVSRTIGKNQNKKVVGSNQTVDQMTKIIQASFDSVDALILNREVIKSAIVLSNAKTMVTISGRTLSVAEAIELKGTIAFRQQYLQNLRMQLMRENASVEAANTQLDANIETSLNQIYGSEKSKINDDTYKSVANPQKEQKESALLDPVGIETRIAKLVEEISVLESEIDFTLSESNAKTQITF